MQLDEAENRLKDSESKLARLRGQSNSVKSATRNEINSDNDDGVVAVKKERISNSPVDRNERSYKSNNNRQSKTELVIPTVTPKISRPSKASGSESTPQVHTPSITGGKSEKSRKEQQVVEVKEKVTKRKLGKIFIK